MIDDAGKPTRLALSAHAWGERVPKTLEDAQKLAAKGSKLLEKYKASQQPIKKASGVQPSKRVTRTKAKA